MVKSKVSSSYVAKTNEQSVINEWTDEEFFDSLTSGLNYELRKYQQGSREFHPDFTLEDMQAVDRRAENYIRSHEPYKGEIYRGIESEENLSFAPGQIIDQRGTSLWTSDKSSAQRRAKLSGRRNQNRYIFVVPKNKSAVDVSEPGAKEKELLASKSTKYRVTQTAGPRRYGGITYVYLEEV